MKIVFFKYLIEIAQSCKECLELGETQSGVFEIYSSTLHNGYDPIKLYCDQEKDGGGWEILLRRQDGSINFHEKPWDDYVKGFGNLESEFWLGLQYFHRLNQKREMMLRFNSTDGQSKYVKYRITQLGSTYTLSIHRYDEGEFRADLV